MGEFIVYATKNDSETIRKWINDEPDIAWIVKIAEQENQAKWRAVGAIDAIQEACYSLWHTKSGPLNIPSGDPGIPDVIVVDPFGGWSQTMQRPGATSPWFGGNLPGPYIFHFAEFGREAPGEFSPDQDLIGSKTAISRSESQPIERPSSGGGNCIDFWIDRLLKSPG